MGEILVNTVTNGLQYQPDVDSVTGTHYLVVWSDSGSAAIRGQVLTADGARSGDEFTVSAPAADGGEANRQWPTVCATGFQVAVAWLEKPLNAPPAAVIKARRLVHGQPAGSEVQVSAGEVAPDSRPSLTRMVDGGFVATWTDPRPDRRIRAQRFDAEGGRAGAEFTVNTTDGFHTAPTVSLLADGSYLVAWQSDPVAIGGGRLVFRLFDFEGTPLGGEIQPDVSGFRGGGSVTLLDNGRFVVAHVDEIAESDLGVVQSTVQATVFEADGSEVTGLSAGTPHGFSRSCPALAPLPGGRFVFAWVEQSADTFATVPAVMAQVCSDTQGSLTDKVQVSTATSGDKFQVGVATAFGAEAESAFVAWADDSRTGGDTSDFAVRGRAFRITPPGTLS